MKKYDLDLLTNTKNLVIKEKEYTLKILKNLIEIEKKKLFVELGFSSLHSYCVEVLGYASSEAYLRISAMRLMREFKAVEDKIGNGKLSLTAVGELQIQVNRKEKESGKKIEKEVKIKLLQEIEGKSTRVASKIVKEELQIEEKLKPNDFILNEVSVKKLKKLSAKMEVTDLNQLVQMLVAEKEDRLIEKNQVLQKGENTSALKPDSVKENKVITRYIPLKIRRQVFIRANYHCENRINGSRCASKKYLHIDHIKPFSLGGVHTLENLRIYCSSCNQRERVKMFGVNWKN